MWSFAKFRNKGTVVISSVERHSSGRELSSEDGTMLDMGSKRGSVKASHAPQTSR